MAYDLLTTSGINSLISTYINSETNNKITPLNTRKTRYQDLDAAYVTVSGKLNTLNSLLSTLKVTGTSSAFLDKSSTSSNENFVSAAISGTALAGSYSMRVNQLAQNDLVLSEDPASTSNNAVITAAGTHNFVITAGDGAGGTLTSNVSVVFNTTDFVNGAITNASLMSKIAGVINNDTAVVSSASVTGSTASSGSFTVDLGGTKTTINYTAGTYSAVMDNIVTQLNAIQGISAQKIINGSNYQLQITVNDNSKYISLSGDTGTLLTELGISNTKEISAAGMVTASVFSPTTSTSQLSLTAKKSGYDYRILSLTDEAGSQALASVGLNLGATRQSFVQNAGLDTPGYVYATTQLNAKLQFNGINVERNSNVITDLVSNVTLNLKSVMQATDPTVNVTVQNDTTKIRGKIQSFIDTFNDLYKFIKSKTVSSNGTRGVLVGDSNATTLQRTLYSTTTSDVAGLSTGQINSLSKLGITFDINNGLSVTNPAQLDNAISSSIDQVAAVFNSTNGIATVLYDRITPYLTAATGYIDTARNRFSSAIQNLNDTISSKQARINSSADSLRKQYIQLQSQLSQLLSMQSYFSSGSSLFGG